MDTDLYPVPPPSVRNQIYFSSLADVLDPHGERETPKRTSIWTDGYDGGLDRCVTHRYYWRAIWISRYYIMNDFGVAVPLLSSWADPRFLDGWD